MERTRLDDMLERYGEVCTQKVAAQLLKPSASFTASVERSCTGVRIFP